NVCCTNFIYYGNCTSRISILLLYAFKREKSRDACHINFWWCMGCVSNISWFSCYQLVVKDWRISSSLLFLFNKYKLMLLLYFFFYKKSPLIFFYFLCKFYKLDLVYS